MPALSSIHVVAGLLLDGANVCLTRRRASSHQGGKWEFPGGKVEAGEAPLAALKRELHEELGIDVEQAKPFLQIRHAYPEREVLLDIWHIQSYRGKAHGREGQELRWTSPADVAPHEMPDADRPALRRLQLPSLYVISNTRRFGLSEFANHLERALQAGVRLVQLREPDLSRDEFCSYARELAGLCHRHQARLLINADPAWVAECEADGVHLNSARLLASSARPLDIDGWVAASCHSAAELKHADNLQLDFAVLGPVQPTTSHANAAALGWERFRLLNADVALPIYALGGMQSSDVAIALLNGAQGVAMISGIWGQHDIEAVVRTAMQIQPFASVR